jgi:hypothetical protein
MILMTAITIGCVIYLTLNKERYDKNNDFVAIDGRIEDDTENFKDSAPSQNVKDILSDAQKMTYKGATTDGSVWLGNSGYNVMEEDPGISWVL